MKYLSDLLYVDIDTSGFLVPNIDYQVWMISPTASGNSEELIYTGRIWKTGGKVRIYLNDIIATHTYDNSYVYDPNFTHTSNGVLFNIKVVIPSIDSTIYLDATPYIMNYYRDAKSIIYNNMTELSNDVIPSAYNLLNQRTYVYPRIPKLGYATENFWVGALIATTTAWRYNNELDGEAVYRIAAMKDNSITSTYNTYDNSSLVHQIRISDFDLMELTNAGDKIVFTGIPQNYNDSIPLPIAIVDECPSDYYLIWIDRTGAYQCQPFNGKVTLSESLSTNYRYDSIDTEIPFNKKVTDKWNLNSNWLTYEEYKAYESIFTSKYLYLFDTKNDEGWEVVLDTNKWTEKTKENKDKMFNLQLDMHSARPQNILY